MTIVTDSAGIADKKNPDENNIFNIYKLLGSEEEVKTFRNKLENGGVGYGTLKQELAEKIISFVKPMRDKRDKITEKEVLEVLKTGAEKARRVVQPKMQEIREKCGLIKSH